MQHQRTTLSKLRNRTFKALAFLAALYPLMRRPILTWGATSEEAASRLPGDELLEGADGVSTRAITIDAPAASVWPWLAQMGPSPRGGAYTYDWIENLLGQRRYWLNRHARHGPVTGRPRTLASCRSPRARGYGSARRTAGC